MLDSTIQPLNNLDLTYSIMVKNVAMGPWGQRTEEHMAQDHVIEVKCDLCLFFRA